MKHVHLPPLALSFLALCWASSAWAGEVPPTVACASPNGRFALRITPPQGTETTDHGVDLIEQSTGEVVANLGSTPRNYLENTVLIWSADSKRVAYNTCGSKQGEMHVFSWNGSAFDEAELPEDLPGPKIEFGKKARGGAVKNYGGTTRPVRWLKSGDLEASSELTMLSRVDDRSYTGTIAFTIAFDAKRHATVHHVGKTKTTVD